ncbi:WD40 repeat-like protein [Glarea lozoyensis ATCC 20868]|uniref:WD40 repeat-like protein n=1 Tax=Glarea lozoyensis (strain ATCC 20868 / MF5171) TaxID=1116229 RepID=S3DPK7_GLAL2|nr:WD40 repeat-like protein [Glarea lozoyensis ATCC 20868]EPE28383.1 WD40 repeat-like protein [Glarea lozoyensis ATCC 20868]
MAPTIQYEISNPPTDAVSAVKFAPGSPTRLLVSSWDRKVYLYEISSENENGDLIQAYTHRAPVLDVCFGKDDNEAFTAGMDWQVKRLNLETGEQDTLSAHTAPVKSVVYSREHSLLVSASWDSTLHFHDVSSPSNEPIKITLPAKPHSLSITASKLVVAMASRLVYIYDLQDTLELAAQSNGAAPDIKPWQQRESSLKFMTRAVACMPNDDGYASSSIEGRVAVEWFDPSTESQARKYAFKCHRQPDPEGDGTDIVYPVNALAFHPVYGTFASGGGDGVVALWDANAKRRIRQYQKYPQSVAALGFSSDGKFLAIGVCPGFENGQEEYSGEGVTKIYIRELGETEAKGKAPK